MTKIFALIVVLSCAIAPVASAAELRGKVVDEKNAPIAEATVVVRSVRPTSGPSYSGSMYPDWGKKAQTDASGQFVIGDLDGAMRFSLMVVAEGQQPATSDRVDPKRQNLTIKMKAQIPERLEASHTVRGKVVDPNGQPVWGAEVEGFGMQRGKDRWWGGVDGDRYTVTNAKGEFVLTTKNPDVQVDVRVRGRGFAPQNMALLSTGDGVHDVQMMPGVTITGRLVSEGNPVAGAVMGLSQEHRGVENDLGGPVHALTDGAGRFTFVDVAPGQTYNIFGAMNSLRELNLLVPRHGVTTNDPGDKQDVGDLEVTSGFTLAGQIRMSDGKKIPGGTKVSFSRDSLSDSQEVAVDAQGRFEFKGVPGEAVWFNVRMKGYRPSSENVCFDALNGHNLIGLIDDHITDLCVLMEPGEPQFSRGGNSTNQHGHQQHELKNIRLFGVDPQTPAGATNP
jgi:hypothetical protein